jgi:putative addiction module CopG family antidote
MDQMNVSITDELAEYVRARVKSGRYNNASEVVREALRRMEQDDERAIRLAEPTVEDVVTNLTAAQAEAIRARVLEGIEEIERGQFDVAEGRAGLAELSRSIKARGRRLLEQAAKR